MPSRGRLCGILSSIWRATRCRGELTAVWPNEFRPCACGRERRTRAVGGAEAALDAERGLQERERAEPVSVEFERRLDESGDVVRVRSNDRVSLREGEATARPNGNTSVFTESGSARASPSRWHDPATRKTEWARTGEPVD